MSTFLGRFLPVPRWICRSLLYPLASLALYYTSALLPPGGMAGAVGYVLAMLAFLLNLPGVLLLQRVYHPPEAPALIEHMVFPAAALLTWGIFVLPRWLLGVAVQRYRRLRA